MFVGGLIVYLFSSSPYAADCLLAMLVTGDYFVISVVGYGFTGFAPSSPPSGFAGFSLSSTPWGFTGFVTSSTPWGFTGFVTSSTPYAADIRLPKSRVGIGFSIGVADGLDVDEASFSF